MALTTPPGVAATAAQRRKARAENARRKREEARRKREEAARARRSIAKLGSTAATRAPAPRRVLNPSGYDLLDKARARQDYINTMNPMALGYNAPEMDIAQKYREILANEGEDAAGDFLRRYDPERTGMPAFLSAIDAATGAVTAFRDPSAFNIGMAAIGVLPLGKAGNFIGLADDVIGKTPIRRLAGGVVKPAARSRTGQIAESFVDDVLDMATGGKHALKSAGKEASRMAETQTMVQQSSGKALEATGRHFSPSQQTALRLMAENVPLDEQAAFFRAQRDAARIAGDAKSARYHKIHESLVGSAKRWVQDGPNGVELRPNAPKKLQEAWRLLETSTHTREEIYKGLGLLTDARIGYRRNAPDMVIRGARWYSKADAAADLKFHNTGSRALLRDIEETAESTARELERTGRQALARSDRSATLAETLTRSTPSFDRDVQRVFGEQTQSYASRRKLRAAIGRHEATITRLSSRIDDLMTRPSGFSSAELARVIRRLNEQTRGLASAKDALRREIRSGSELAQEQEFLGKIADEELLQLEGKVRQSLVAAAAAKGTASTAFKRAQQVAADAAREIERVRESTAKLAEEIQSRADSLVGAENLGRGREYVPSQRGTPGIESLRGVAQGAVAFLTPGGRRSIGAGARDSSLSHSYKAALQLYGNFRTDVTRLTAESLARAGKLAQMRNIHTRLLGMSTDTLPEGAIPGVTHYAIKVDPTKNISESAKAFWDEFQDLQGMTAKELEKRMRHKGTDDSLAELAVEIFDATPNPADAKNFRWVPAEAVDGAIINPYLQRGILNRGGKAPSTALGPRIGGAALDAAADIFRFSTLYLNPAYGPVNFLGNSAMATMQQGIFLPRNIIRAAKIARNLSPEDLAAAHELAQMGGVSRALGRGAARGSRAVTGPIADAFSYLVDRGPRWTAFVHELDKVGIKSADDLADALKRVRNGEREALEKIHVARSKANDALVDFERMTPFERHVVSRVIFFYPWIRGATRWAVRFPLEHPLQAGAIAYGGLKGHEDADDVLGPRPWYAQFDIPVPGWKDENGNPMVLGPRQLLTALTPVEFVGTPIANALGVEGAGALSESSTPLVQLLTGAFTGKNEYGQDFYSIDNAKQTVKGFVPPWRLYETWTQDQEGKVYPRTENWQKGLQMGFGGILKPYSPEAGQARVGAAPSEADDDRAFLADPENNFAPQIQEKFGALVDLKSEFEDALGGADTYEERAIVAVMIYARERPQYADAAKQRLEKALTEGDFETLYRKIRAVLFADELEKLHRYMDKKKDAAERQAALAR